MAHLVIDRALNGQAANSWPRWEEMIGKGAASGFIGAPGIGCRQARQRRTIRRRRTVLDDILATGPAGAKTK